jgi:hypothetical protein
MTWNLDLLLQLSIVRGIASGFPTVLVVRVTDEVEWRRHCTQDSEWQPFVLRGRKTALRALLMSCLGGNPDSGVKDYSGCFGALFDPSSASDKIYLRHLGIK